MATTITQIAQLVASSQAAGSIVPQHVLLVGEDGVAQSVGGGSQYTEDAAAAANPVGTVPMLIRTDTPAGQVTTDGDNVAQRGTNYGAAYVTVIDASGGAVAFGAGTQYTEDAAAAANPLGTALSLVREDGRAGSLTTTDGDNVMARGTNYGELYVKHVDSIIVTTAQALDYDTGAGTQTTQLVGIALPASGGPVAGGTSTNPIYTTGAVSTSGGYPTTDAHIVAAGTAGGDAGVVKASAGQLYGVHVFNKADYPVYVKIHNLASAPTPGTTAVVRTIGVQAGLSADVIYTHGLALGTGIAYSIVKLLPDNDATAVVAADCVVDFDYK